LTTIPQSSDPRTAERDESGQQSAKSVYFFGDGRAEGTKDMKAVLGGKGANLAEMTNLGVPVPPGFTIATSLCMEYLGAGATPADLRPQVEDALRRLERATHKIFGDPASPTRAERESFLHGWGTPHFREFAGRRTDAGASASFPTWRPRAPSRSR